MVRHDIPDNQDPGPGKFVHDRIRPSVAHHPFHKRPIVSAGEKKPDFMAAYLLSRALFVNPFLGIIGWKKEHSLLTS
jgi:hypothetical protein